MTDANLRFPSGRPLRACRNDAKRLALSKGISLSEVQDKIAALNGAPLGWSRAVNAMRSAVLAHVAPTIPSGPRMVASDIEAVMRLYPVTRYGFGPSDYAMGELRSYQRALQAGQDELLANADECSKALRFLAHVSKRKTDNPRVGTSYGLKHRAEHFIRNTVGAPSDEYVSNGALICAAVHLGFELKHRGSPNVTFNMSSRSPVFEWAHLKEKARTGNLMPEGFPRLNALEDQLGTIKTPDPWEFLRKERAPLTA